MLTAAARPQWPAAVSSLVLEAITGPRRPARVLGAFPTCVYLDLGEHDTVLALLARDALLQPIGLRLAASSAQLRWGVVPGDTVSVGAGRVRLPSADVVAARVHHPARVTSPPHPDRVNSFRGHLDAEVVHSIRWGGLARAVGLDPGDGALADLAHDLAAAALAGRPVAPHLRGLIGAGAGLTPSGDDAVAGVLLALRSAGELESVDRLASDLLPLLPSTTSISAALLRAAAEGYAVPEVVTLVEAIHGSTNRKPGPVPPDSGPSDGWFRLVDPRLVERVLAIGHSSGRDLISGVAGTHRALAAVAQRPRSHATTQEGVLHG